MAYSNEKLYMMQRQRRIDGTAVVMPGLVRIDRSRDVLREEAKKRNTKLKLSKWYVIPATWL
jgi:hypothetical protein